MFSEFLALVSIAMGSVEAAAPADAPLQPVEKWVVDYGETQCTAARAFGSKSDPIILGIIPSIDGTTYALVVSRPRSGPDVAEELPGSVDFGNGPIAASLLYYGVKSSKSSMYRYRISAAEMAQARSAPSLTVHARGSDGFTFALSSIPALLDGLQKCTADLQQYWNMEEGPQSPIVKLAKGDVRDVFSGQDYPADAMFNGQEGKAQYELLIDQKGNVAGCDIVVASGVAALDAMGCQVIRERAKFTPAFDRQGQPVRSVVTTPPVQWQIGH